MSLTLICAIDENNSLGKENQLLWHLPDDFLHFKNLTMGHSVIMGRKTFESLPKALPKRKNIVITRQKNYMAIGGVVVSSLEEALKEALKDDDNPFVIGGGEIYRVAMPLATRLEITRVHATFEADTFFPEINPSLWKLTRSEYHPKDEKHAYDFSFETYIKTCT